MNDVDREQHGERARARFLVDAATVLSSSLDVDETLGRVAELIVPRIADWCLVELLDGGVTRQIALRHQDPSKLELARRIRERFPARPDSPAQRALHAGEPRLIREIDERTLNELTEGPEHLELVRELGMRSAMAVPMIARSRVLGAITFVSAESGRTFGEDDLEMAEQLAERAALAIDNARLFEAERAARAAAERANERLGRLQAVMAELAVALSSERVGEIVVDNGLEAIGALTGALYVVPLRSEHASLRASRGFPPEAIERFARIELDGPAPLADCIRRRQPIFIESREDYARLYAASEARSRDLIAESVRSIACVPLLSGEAVLGALAFAFGGLRSFDSDERRFLTLLGDHSALALERALLYEAERRARSESELLYELVGTANRASDAEAVYDAALDALGKALGVDRTALLLCDEGGAMRFKAWRNVSEAHRKSVEGHTVWPRDATEFEPVLVAHALRDPAYASYRELLETEQIGAMAFVPLVDQGRLLGKLMVYAAEPRVFSDDEVRLARTIANQVAEVVVRKRLYAEARAARSVAEAEAVAREQLLAVVAHDLRNLLHAAELRGSLLVRQLDAKPDHVWVKQELVAVLRSTDGMSRLIGDLLDAAVIDAGRLSVEKRPLYAGELFDAAIETARVVALDRDVEICSEARLGDARIHADRARLLQVIANLVGNAVKFSPRHGSVLIEARAGEGELCLVVRDRGPGIPPDRLARVFERYYKGDTDRPGVGLGLFISKALVEAHSGTLTIESEPGSGTSVTLRLPLTA